MEEKAHMARGKSGSTGTSQISRQGYMDYPGWKNKLLLLLTKGSANSVQICHANRLLSSGASPSHSRFSSGQYKFKISPCCQENLGLHAAFYCSHLLDAVSKRPMAMLHIGFFGPNCFLFPFLATSCYPIQAR
jgi:hypothetical protein